MAVDGSWTIVMSTPMGDRAGGLTLKVEGDRLTGAMSNEFGETLIEDGEIDGDHLFWRTRMTVPIPMTVEFDVDVAGDRMTGSAQLGAMGEAPVTATRT